MKKTPLILAAIAAAVLVTAAAAGARPAAGKPVEVVFWHAQTDSAQPTPGRGSPASSSRSRPAAQPMPGVGARPSTSASPS